jgi:hypothetical protein
MNLKKAYFIGNFSGIKVACEHSFYLEHLKINIFDSSVTDDFDFLGNLTKLQTLEVIWGEIEIAKLLVAI